MIETIEQIGGRALGPGERFTFSCQPELACFNTCCRNKRLSLFPYDLLRIRQGLNLDSPRILEQYVDMEFDPNSGWPALRLKLDEDGRCPFVSAVGCRIYPHRPAACRIYPLARAVAPDSEGGVRDEKAVIQETSGCLGWEKGDGFTAPEWYDNQGLGPYHDFNDRFLKLFMHPGRKGRLDLTPRQIHAVIMALYNIDVFKEMVRRPELGRLFEPVRLEAALDSDEALLLLGRDFLIGQLFGS